MSLKFVPELFEEWERIIIFVQKNNDQDTLSMALATAKLIESHYGKNNKEVKIAGLRGKNIFFPEIDDYKYDKEKHNVKDAKKTLAVLSEITWPTEVKNMSLLKLCGAIVQINHHSEEDKENKDDYFDDEIKKKVILNVCWPEYSSVCEVLWELINKKDSGWNVTLEIAEILFYGLIADTVIFKSELTNKKTFLTVVEMMDKGLNVQHHLDNFISTDIEAVKIFCNAILNSVHEKNLLVINLNPQIVYDLKPNLFMKQKNGMIMQKKVFTYVLKRAYETIKVNTIVFIHYCLFEPFNSDKKIVYIVLKKSNKALEEVLRSVGFKKARGKWIKICRFSEIQSLLERYKELFVC